MFDDVTTDNYVGYHVRTVFVVIPLFKTYFSIQVTGWPAITRVKTVTSVSRRDQLSQEVPLPASNLDHASAGDLLFRCQPICKPFKILVEVRRTLLFIFVAGAILQPGKIKSLIENKTTAMTYGQFKISAWSLDRRSLVLHQQILMNRNFPPA